MSGGKGWAKGKTAATDPRVASAAATHRGMNYVRQTPPENCRWLAREESGRSLRSLPLEWSPTMAYVVGLMATDGCRLLDGDGSLLDYWYEGTGKAAGKRYEGFRTVFNSASRKHLEWLQTVLGRVAHVRGALHAELPNEHGTVLWRLGYAIRESAILLPRIYAAPDAPCLRRKFLIWQDYATRHALRVSNDAIAETDALYDLSGSPSWIVASSTPDP